MSKDKKASGKKTDPTTPAPAPPATDMTAVIEMIADLKSSLTAEVRASTSSLEAKLASIHVTISEHGQRLTSLEDSATVYTNKVDELEARCVSMEEAYTTLKQRLIGLEARGRRNNIRIVGLGESIEKDQPNTFFSEVLVEILGNDLLPTPPELDIVHRALAPKPAPGARPRAVIARVHRHQVKEMIVKEARKKRGKLNYRGTPVFIYEDYPQEVVEERKKYKDVMSALYQRGHKPTLLYPSRLFVSTKDGKIHLKSPKDAKAFLKRTQRDSESRVSSADEG